MSGSLPAITKPRLALLVAFILTTALVMINQDAKTLTWQESYDKESPRDGVAEIACKFPYLDPFSSAPMKFYHKYPTIKCPDGLPTFTYYDGTYVRVNQTLKQRHLGQTKVSCWYREVTYERTSEYITGRWKGPFSDAIVVKEKPPFVEIKCRDENKQIVSAMQHYVTRNEIRKSEIPAKHNFKDKQMNVLMVGMDSVSKQLFRRAMPQTRRYLLEKMGAIEMNVYNKVGSNTFPNMLALTTGKYEEELTDWTHAQGFDPLPFIWKDFKVAGYRTQYMSDRMDFDDFAKPPTDSFNYPMVQALMKGKIAFDNDCFEDQIEVNLWLNLIKEFAWNSLHTTGRFFSIAMIDRPTHDFPNKASAVDEHYANFLKDIYETKLLNNTFFLFYSDHGSMKGRYRATYEGSLEERSANIVVFVPHWFREKYSHLYRNLLTNANRLTTNFDIHHTLKSIANFDYEEKARRRGKSLVEERSLSLFSESPVDRTCEKAEIPPHFCMCTGGIPVYAGSGKYDYLFEAMAQPVVDTINMITSVQRDKCAIIRLANVTSLTLITGKIAQSGAYRVMFTTEPGNAAFEATVEYSVMFFFFTSAKPLGFISRISVYKGLSDCVEEDTFLRLYCYCKDLLPV